MPGIDKIKFNNLLCQIVIILRFMQNNKDFSFQKSSKDQIQSIQTSNELNIHFNNLIVKNNERNSEKQQDQQKKLKKKLSNLVENFDIHYLSNLNLSPQKIKISPKKSDSLQKKKVIKQQKKSQIKQWNLQQEILKTEQHDIYDSNQQQTIEKVQKQIDNFTYLNRQYFFVQKEYFKQPNVENKFNINANLRLEQIKQKVKELKKKIIKSTLKKSNSTGSSSPKSSLSSLQLDLLTCKNNLCKSIMLDQDDNGLSIESFQIISFLGEGIYGKVILAKDKKTNFLVALKQISKLNMNADTSSYLARQIKIQSFLHHPNIVQLYNFFDDEDYIYLILEICNSGNLYSYMIKEGPFSQKKTKQIVRQICQAIDYLHKNDIIHRDLKPQNILLHNNVIKLCDFGWAVQSPLSRGTLCGTPIYASPQLVQKKGYDTKIDIWNIGIMTYQFLFGYTPFSIKEESDLQRIITDQVIFPPQFQISEACKDFILQCLQKDPKNRGNIVQLKDHEFLHQQQKFRASMKQSLQKLNS